MWALSNNLPLYCANCNSASGVSCSLHERKHFQVVSAQSAPAVSMFKYLYISTYLLWTNAAVCVQPVNVVTCCNVAAWRLQSDHCTLCAKCGHGQGSTCSYNLLNIILGHPAAWSFAAIFHFFPSPLDLVLGTVFVSVPLKNMYKRKLALAALAQNCLSYLFKVLYTIHIGNTRPRHYTPEIQVP